jgi:Holliday junction resolvase
MGEEQKYQSKVLTYLRARGIYAVKIISASRSGVPDIICCIGGLFVAIECKSDVGSQTELQRYNERGIIDSNGIYIISKPKNFIQLKFFINNLLERN